MVTSEPARVASAPDVETDDGPTVRLRWKRKGSRNPCRRRLKRPLPTKRLKNWSLSRLKPVGMRGKLSGEPCCGRRRQDGSPSRAGLPRLEFEAPGGLRVVETPSGGRGPAAAFEARRRSSRGPSFPRGRLPVPSPPAAETLDPSAGPAEAAHDAGPASVPPAVLPPQSDPVVVPGTLRGVMGYRMPLVSRQALPDQVVSGVLIPAHTTYVILQPGYWELVGLSPDDVKGIAGVCGKDEGRPRGGAFAAARPGLEPLSAVQGKAGAGRWKLKDARRTADMENKTGGDEATAVLTFLAIMLGLLAYWWWQLGDAGRLAWLGAIGDTRRPRTGALWPGGTGRMAAGGPVTSTWRAWWLLLLLAALAGRRRRQRPAPETVALSGFGLRALHGGPRDSPWLWTGCLVLATPSAPIPLPYVGVAVCPEPFCSAWRSYKLARGRQRVQ